jgi:hypothetical protein
LRPPCVSAVFALAEERVRLERPNIASKPIAAKDQSPEAAKKNLAEDDVPLDARGDYGQRHRTLLSEKHKLGFTHAAGAVFE